VFAAAVLLRRPGAVTIADLGSGLSLQLPPAESGEVFQGEYRPKPNLGGSYSLPYEYEG